MIATIRLDENRTISLNDELDWESEDAPGLADVLNRRHRGTFEEWRGEPGAWQTADALAFLAPLHPHLVSGPTG